MVKIISWNVNGIRACDKKGFIDFFEREDPDILCLQETKAHPEQLDDHLLQPFGYAAHWSSAERRGYSGTVTYLREEEMARNVAHGIGIKKFDSEGRFVVTEHEDFLLYNVYFPNGSSREERHNFKQEFLRKFLRHLSRKIKEGHSVIVVGDYNVAHTEIDVHDPKRLAKESGFLPEEREWFDEFLKAGFVDLFRDRHPEEEDRYSWWSYRERARVGNRGWRIDYICVTEDLAGRVTRADLLDQQMGSDHCPVVVELD